MVNISMAIIVEVAKVNRVARTGVLYLIYSVSMNTIVESQKLLTGNISSLKDWPEAFCLYWIVSQWSKIINNLWENWVSVPVRKVLTPEISLLFS